MSTGGSDAPKEAPIGTTSEGVAARARAEAEAVGAIGPAISGDGGKALLTPMQKALRDFAIVTSLHAGRTVRDVARDFEITVAAVRRVWKRWRDTPSPLDARPIEIVERLTRAFEQQMDLYARLAFEASQETVRIAALKGYATASDRYVQMLGDVGKLPRNLGLLRTEAAIRRMLEQLVDRLHEAAAGDITIEDVLDWLEIQTRPPGAPPELPPGD